MSFIIYDRLAISVARSNYEWSFYRRFDKFWNKDSSHYNQRMVIYNGSPLYTEDDKDFTKFLNALGLSYDDVLGPEMLNEYSKSEIEEYWFELREPVVQSKDDKFEYDDAIKYIPNFVVGQQFQVEFNYGSSSSGFYLTDDIMEHTIIDLTDPSNPVYLTNPMMTPVEIRDKIMEYPGQYVLGDQKARPTYSRGSIVLVNNEPFSEVYMDASTFNSISDKIDYPFKPIVECAYSYPGYYWYALFDINETNFELVNVSDPIKETWNEDPSKYGLKWRATYRVKSNIDASSEPLIRFIDKFNSYWFTNRYTAPEPISQTQNDYAKEYPLSKYPELWENGLLKVDAANKMKKSDFAVMLSESFTSDYKVKEPEWWEKLFGIVVSIAGVVVGVILCCTGTGSVIIGIGQGLMAASVTWAVGALSLGAIGGASTYGIVKNIAGVAQIASITGGIFMLFAKIGNGIKSLTEMLSSKIDDFLEIFSFDKKVNINQNIIVEDINYVSDIEIDDALNYAFENNIDLKEIFINPNDLTSPRFNDAMMRYQQQKLLNQELVKGMFDLGNYIYNQYNRNILVEEYEKYIDLVDEYRELLEENSPSNFYEVLGDKNMVYSLGSFDAISMLDLKIEQNIGVNTINTDPVKSIT